MSKTQTIALYNTQTKKTQPVALENKKPRIYSCGPTLYQQAHIGNMRMYVFADTLNRTFRHFNYKPKHVINFTDVGHLTDDADAGEDKVEKQAKQEKKSAKEITEQFGHLFLQDLKKLNIPTKNYHFPKATDYIKEQIEIVQELEKKGHTYDIPDGIYFDTKTWKEYGALGLPTDENDDEHARIEPVEGKKHPRDFALWKRTPKGITRQQEWDSPWGRGFPGWHIECSAMAMKLLGETIDIHTGGMDHITVHHNNEIAQSEAMTQKTFAHIWMHGAFLTIKDEKVSKSLGNTYTINDLEEKGYEPLALRYLFLQSAYRTPLSFSFKALTSAQTALQRLQKEYNTLPHNFLGIGEKKDKTYSEQIDKAIADDLNTAKVLALLWDILRDKTLNPKTKRATATYADRILGLLKNKTPTKKETEVPKEIQNLLKERDDARREKDYETADALRKKITELGYDITDKGENSTATKR